MLNCLNKIYNGAEHFQRTIFMTCSAVCATGESTSSAAETREITHPHNISKGSTSKMHTCR